MLYGDTQWAAYITSPNQPLGQRIGFFVPTWQSIARLTRKGVLNIVRTLEGSFDPKPYISL